MSQPARLAASRDDQTGQVYVPARRFAADGSLRVCTPIEVPARGVLVSWTRYQDENYGLVDLPDAVRIQVLLGDGPHEIGATYTGATTDGSQTVRFFRE